MNEHDEDPLGEALQRIHDDLTTAEEEGGEERDATTYPGAGDLVPLFRKDLLKLMEAYDVLSLRAGPRCIEQDCDNSDGLHPYHMGPEACIVRMNEGLRDALGSLQGVLNIKEPPVNEAIVAIMLALENTNPVPTPLRKAFEMRKRVQKFFGGGKEFLDAFDAMKETLEAITPNHTENHVKCLGCMGEDAINRAQEVRNKL